METNKNAENTENQVENTKNQTEDPKNQAEKTDKNNLEQTTDKKIKTIEEALENINKNQSKKDSGELKNKAKNLNANNIDEFQDTLKNYLGKVEDIENELQKLNEKQEVTEKKREIADYFNNITKNIKTDKTVLKELIGYNNITDKDDLKYRIEQYKKLMDLNGQPYAAGKSQDEKGRKKIYDDLAKKEIEKLEKFNNKYTGDTSGSGNPIADIKSLLKHFKTH